MNPMVDDVTSRWTYVPGPALPGDWGGTLGGFSEDLGRPLRRLEVACPQLKLVIGFGTVYELTPVGSRAPAGRHRAFAIGMAGGPMTAAHGAAQSCIELELPPWAAHRLFGGDRQPLEAGVVDLADIWGREADLLVEALHEQPAWPQRFAIIRRFLARRLEGRGAPLRPELRWAWEQLAQQQGRLPVRALQQRLGWSERHFTTSFAAAVGLGPKAAARRLRFGQVCRLMTDEPDSAIADLAAVCGYSDQSHLTREFREFAGCAPAAYMRAGIAGALGKPAELLDA
ncbi:AraC family transcriptional regulator [Roseateles cavernae]|uniref:AraC family transcriptional regulator n=1 Tax=Roseateles cavernae TaxID=3153578 RepID=UPI0032E3D228